MRDHMILYFSVNRQHVEDFNDWAKKRKPIKWIEKDDPDPVLDDLPMVISKQKEKKHLYVIIDYLSLIKGISSDNDNAEYKDIAALVRRTILQFPEVGFLFDQSDVPDNWISGIEFLLGEVKTAPNILEVAQFFHIFRKEDGFVLLELGYDNIFDGSNLRWAVRRKYYADLELDNEEGNFNNLQKKRKDSLAVVVDDEPRQSRFNGFALYASGYHVIQVYTARMLLALNNCVNKGLVKTPKIILRDFDLQFPDASKRKDYDEKTNKYKNVLLWDKDYRISREEIEIDLSSFGGDGKMIDSIRNYRFDTDKNEDGECPWVDGIYNNEGHKSEFWGWAKENEEKKPLMYVVTNGHDMLHINHSKYNKWNVKKKDHYMEVWGLEKPVSGLYYPFFTKFKDYHGNPTVKKNFDGTRYGKKDGKKYCINKKRKDHNHGVPIDIYETVCEMQRRAEEYYKDRRYVKAAIVAQETIELLNGFHYQMMIKAYQIKFLAENSIAMNIIGANELQLVLDAEERIKIIKEDIRRIVYPLNKGEKHFFLMDIVTQYRRKKKEHELLGHIFSDCRDTCRENEYFDVEAVFIREMAHLDQRNLGLVDLIRYIKHRIFISKINKVKDI